MKLWDRLVLPWQVLSAMERDLARVQWAQAEILTKLREIKKMTVVVAEPGDRATGLVELWQLVDQFSVTDPDLAAQLHAVWNKLVVNEPGESEGPDAA